MCSCCYTEYTRSQFQLHRQLLFMLHKPELEQLRGKSERVQVKRPNFTIEPTKIHDHQGR
jgi:hypothetical protein